MSDLPNCPVCDSPYAYENGPLLTCPDCQHEWSAEEASQPTEIDASEAVTDAHGTPLQSGDTVKLVKDLKVKGTPTTLKIGTKVKNIRVVESSHDGHDIDCKVDGVGQIKLKSSLVKKI